MKGLMMSGLGCGLVVLLESGLQVQERLQRRRQILRLRRKYLINSSQDLQI